MFLNLVQICWDLRMKPSTNTILLRRIIHPALKSYASFFSNIILWTHDVYMGKGEIIICMRVLWSFKLSYICDFGLARVAFDDTPTTTFWIVCNWIILDLDILLSNSILIYIFGRVCLWDFDNFPFSICDFQDYISTRWYRAPELCESFFSKLWY